jgi:hypothetical protein
VAGCLQGKTAVARAFLREVLEGPIQFRPVVRGKERGYAFRGQLALGAGLMSGIVDATTTTMASPVGSARRYVRNFERDFIAAA